MSLDFTLSAVRQTVVFDTNMTHNVTTMAKVAGIYDCLWRPEESGYLLAGDLVEPLRKGIKHLETFPDQHKDLEAPNGWGTYDQFLPWVKEVLEACEANPDAEIDVCR